MTKPTEYLTVREASILLGVSTTQIWRLLKADPPELTSTVGPHPNYWTLLSRREVEARRKRLETK